MLNAILDPTISNMMRQRIPKLIQPNFYQFGRGLYVTTLVDSSDGCYPSNPLFLLSLEDQLIVRNKLYQYHCMGLDLRSSISALQADSGIEIGSRQA